MLAGAVDCVRRDGLAGATSRAITTTAQANLGAITYYFGSKDALLAEALLGVIRYQLEPVVAILSGDQGDARARMLAAVAALLSGFEAVRQDAPVYLEALVNGPRFPALSAGVVELLGRMSRFLAQQVAEVQAVEHLPGWIDPTATADLLIAVAHGIVLTAVIDPERVQPAVVAAQFAALLLAVLPT